MDGACFLQEKPLPSLCYDPLEQRNLAIFGMESHQVGSVADALCVFHILEFPCLVRSGAVEKDFPKRLVVLSRRCSSRFGDSILGRMGRLSPASLGRIL